MCGIAGIIAHQPGEWLAPAGDAMLARLVHRGPDDHGWLCLRGDLVQFGQGAVDSRPANALLLHRRLSILDLSPAGRQPMSYDDGRYWITFNGEIYNYLELREELIALGQTFRTQSDTEVLLAAYAQWGEKCLTRLVGMFAFAILDTRSRKLFLARDFFGIKPLYYALTPRGIAFASEIKALFELSDLPRRIDPEPLFAYLRFGLSDHSEATLLRDVRHLPPAHSAEIDLDRPAPPVPRRYWELKTGPTLALSFDEAAARTRELFLDNVRLHLRSDVPLGTALSGGIDSSAIVMAVRQLAGAGQEFHSFSFIAGEKEVDEERWIDLVVDAAQTQMHKVSITSAELVGDFDRLIETQDEPFGSTSIYAQHRVFRLAHEAGIKVLLDGQGADEMLGGYRSYLPARVCSLLRQGRFIAAWQLSRRAARLPGANGWDILGRAAAFLLPEMLKRPLRRLAGEPVEPSWLNARWLQDQGASLRVPYDTAAGSTLRGQLHDSLTRTSLPALLRYEDRNSMAYSLESRVPFLTPQLVEFLFQLPEEYLIDRQATSKAVFRSAMRGLVPDAILDRRDKIGFGTPEKAWLASIRPWMERMLASEAARTIPALNLPVMRREIEGVFSGRARFDWRIWRWLNLIRWTERWGVSYS